MFACDGRLGVEDHNVFKSRHTTNLQQTPIDENNQNANNSIITFGCMIILLIQNVQWKI